MIFFFQRIGGKSNREEDQNIGNRKWNHYESNEFNEFCIEASIKSETTVPYTLEKNGIGQRKN